MKRIFAGTAAALLAAALFFPCHVRAVSAEHAIVMDAQTGRILYEKNADERGLIASTTKIMTALIVSEQCNVLDRMRIPKEAVGIEGSSMYLQEGEILTIQELLYGLMLRSGNDAAVALAIYCGGTVEGFVSLMNDKAHRLGLEDTHFANPNGLDHPDHYSSARDLAVLTAYAMKNPIFAKTVATKSVTVGNRCLKNHNKLLWMVPGADGVKTGYTKAAGRILVSTALREERRLIVVTMNDPDDWKDHSALLEDGFQSYTPQKVVSEGQCVGHISVIGGQNEVVQLLAKEDLVYSLAADEVPQFVISEPRFVYAPVAQGQDAGTVYFCLNGQPAAKIPVCYGETVEMEQSEEKHSFWSRLFGAD